MAEIPRFHPMCVRLSVHIAFYFLSVCPFSMIPIEERV